MRDTIFVQRRAIIIRISMELPTAFTSAARARLAHDGRMRKSGEKWLAHLDETPTMFAITVSGCTIKDISRD
jgi:hypothetical protein